MPKKDVVFSDLDFDFIPHPVGMDITPLKNEDAIKRSIRNLIFTGKYERLFAPNIGANLKQLLFEPITPVTSTSIQLLISDTIRLYEPRASLLDLTVVAAPDENGYEVSMVIGVDNLSEFITVDFFLERLR